MNTPDKHPAPEGNKFDKASTVKWTRAGGGGTPTLPAEKTQATESTQPVVPQEPQKSAAEIAKELYADLADRNNRYEEWLKANGSYLQNDPKAMGKVSNIISDVSLDFDAMRSKTNDLIDAARGNDAKATGAAHKINIIHNDAEHAFSLIRALKLLYAGDKLDGAEGTIDQEVRNGGSPCKGNGLAIPVSLFEQRSHTTMADAIASLQQRQITSTGEAAPLNITSAMPGEYVPPFRHANLLNGLPINHLSGLPGSVTIPVGDGDASADWFAEGTAGTESDLDFRNFNLSPKRLTAIVRFTKEAVLKSRIDLEMKIKDSLAYAMRSKLERTVLTGSSKAEAPTGILKADDLTTYPALGRTNGGTMQFNDLVNLSTLLATQNIGTDGQMKDMAPNGLAMIANYSLRALWLLQKKFPGETDSGGALLPDVNMSAMGVVAGMPTHFTNYLPSNGSTGTGRNLSSLIYGYWPDFTLASWDSMEVIVNPYSDDASAQNRITVHCYHDMGIKRPKSFIALDDIITTPNNN